MAVRGDIRNVAIVAHVDHGKTTLVNAMLAQSHVFNEREEVPDRVMDSNDLEREKGITILAKNTAVQYTGPLAAKYGHPEGITLNIIDTPGHADFGGEVERGISMVDGVVLLVDASEGPLPQTRFVLRKALEAKLPVILCVNKTDRPDARISEVVGESSDLLLGLAQDVIEEGIDLDEDSLFDLPVIYCAAKAGYASENQPENGGLPDNDNLEPLFEAIIKNIPAPEYEEGAPLQAHVANIDSSDFLGRLGLVRIYNGTLEKGKTYGLSRVDGSIENFRVSELLRTQGLERTPVESAGPGDIVAVAGVNDIMIGETIVDPDDPRPLPLIHVDDPAISMTFGINDSPLAGTEGKDHKLTARMIKDRLDRELIGNVSIKVLPTDRPDAWEVQGRGELALAVLAEQMRREGFELTVGRPQVVTKTIDGVVNEPMENTTIDVPEEYMGAVTQLLADRKGRMDNMTNHGTGWVRLQFTVPSRGLIGFRTALLSATRRHRHRLLHLRWLRSVGRPDRDPPERLHGLRPAGRRHPIRHAASAGTRQLLRRAAVPGVRGPGRRHQQQAGRAGCEHHAGQAHDQHAFRHRGRAGNPDPADQDEPRRVPGLRQRGRVRGSHPGVHPRAQDHSEP